MKYSWRGLIHAVRAQARKAYTRSLCFAQRVRYVQSCLLAMIWYIAQIVSLTTAHAQQITTICTWFIWQGAIFRIPVMTLYLPKEEGGWGFPSISAKCRTLLFNRIQMMGDKDGTVLSEQMSNLDLNDILANPPNVARNPLSLSIYDSVQWIWYTSSRTPQLTRARPSNIVYMTC